MLSGNLAKALSNQFNAEYYSAYLYLAMSSAADAMGLKGVANWLFVQAQEEMAHGTHIFEYILERGAAPDFNDIITPPAVFSDAGRIFEMVLEHEQKVTASINNIATLAMQESDHACYQFMMWYVNEQVEEESNATEILNKLKLISGNNGLLMNLDAELSTRVFVNPFPAKA
ncbi:MAG: ferritin [Eubacteriaceae bacterium]|jgi:ferritin|nr:ferritin [Eubacteriaceae bacterium]